MDKNENRSLSFQDSWLTENMVYLTEDTDCGLGIVDSEREAGVFNVDVFCEDEQGNSFVHNKAGDTNKWEEQLGHLLNYSVGASAKTVIWLTSNPSERHVEMVKWLDEITPDIVRWYLFKIEAMKVGNSTPIPFFTMEFSPSQQILCSEKEELAEKYRKRVKFWEGLLTVLNQKMELHKSINVIKEGQRNEVSGTYFQMLVWLDSGFIKIAKIF